MKRCLTAPKRIFEKGYKDASLRTIAQEANTSTGSIYTRFGDKEGLLRHCGTGGKGSQADVSGNSGGVPFF